MRDGKRKMVCPWTLILAVILLSAIVLLPAVAGAVKESRWPGVDEAVIGKIAKEHGREAKESWIGDRGDLLLFAFLLAGAVGGFSAGYYWRVLVTEKRQARKTEKRTKVVTAEKRE